MGSVNELIAVLALVLIGHYSLNKIENIVRRETLPTIQHGMPSLSSFTNRLTCSRLDGHGVEFPRFVPGDFLMLCHS